MEQLFFYCDLTGFKGVIEKQELWLSDIHCMNDSSEETMFLRCLSEVMKRKRDSLSASTKMHLKAKPSIDAFFTDIKEKYTDIAFICCFADGLGDDLSQWRGYANDGKGMCIGFNKEYIQKLNKVHKIKRHTTESNGVSPSSTNFLPAYVFQQDYIQYLSEQELISVLESIINPIVAKYEREIEKSEGNNQIIDSAFTLDLYKALYYRKAFYKNLAFKCEKEYRICFFDQLHKSGLDTAQLSLMRNMVSKYTFDDVAALSAIEYRESRGKLIPFRRLQFTKDFFSKALSSITIGPKNAMTENEIKYILIANGVYSADNIIVSKSISTYQ